MFSLFCAWIYGGVNNREAGDLRRHRTHYDVIVMIYDIFNFLSTTRCGQLDTDQTCVSYFDLELFVKRQAQLTH